MTSVSILIPVPPSHNRSDVLGACLNSIANQSYPKDKTELILVGDGCYPKSDFLSNEIRVKIYNFKKHVGAIKAGNKEIELSKGELLAFIDADCVAKETWLQNLINGFGSNAIGACGGEKTDFINF